MLKKSNKLSNPKQLRGAAWLALLSIAWFQLSAASHQFDHVAGEFADSCHVCVQLDRVDDAVADPSTPTIDLAHSESEPPQPSADNVGRRLVASFEARAPPQL